MAFCQPPDGWITGHLTDFADIMGQKQGCRPQASGCSGGFATRMPAANNHDIEFHRSNLGNAAKTVKEINGFAPREGQCFT